MIILQLFLNRVKIEWKIFPIINVYLLKKYNVQHSICIFSYLADKFYVSPNEKEKKWEWTLDQDFIELHHIMRPT